MEATANNLNWFEIPATDINRAKKFYETIFNVEMFSMEMGDMLMAMFPSEMGSGKASGALVQSDMHVPSTEGCIIYLNANPAMDNVLERIADAGGKVLMPKTEITPEYGFMALFLDSEGNKLALHSQN